MSSQYDYEGNEIDRVKTVKENISAPPLTLDDCAPGVVCTVKAKVTENNKYSWKVSMDKVYILANCYAR